MTDPAAPRMRQPHYDASLLAGASSRVRVRLFPLLADIGRLQTLCDKLFNELLPPSIAVFRPALPVVFVGSLHYPEMSGELPWVTGTMSQNELYFLVPLERYRAVNGREELVELAGATPYIFVDNSESAATGRERLGLAKEAAVFTTPPQGVFGLGGQKLLQVQSWEPTRDGHRLAPLLEVLDATPPRFQLGGGDAESSVRDLKNPLAWLKVVDALKARAEHTLGKETTASVLARLSAYAETLAGSRRLSLYAMRQFPDPERRGGARYQDLVRFEMKVSDVQSVGFLGDGPLASQYRLVLRHSEIRPITRVLGLRVERRTPPLADAETFDVATSIGAVSAQVDVDFVSAVRVCWRSAPNGTAPWRDVRGDVLSPPARPQLVTYFGPSSAVFLQRQANLPVLDVKYLLVPASRAALQRRVDELLPRRAPIRATLVGTGDLAAVRVLASKSRMRGDEESGLVWTDGLYVSISAPANVETPKGAFVANVMFHSYATNGFMVESLRETLGEPAEEAEIAAGEDGWFGTTQDVTALLNVATLGITRTANGASVDWLPLLDFVSAAADPAGDPGAHALREHAWPQMAQILPTVSVGRIPWPETSKGSVLHRVTRLDFDTTEAPRVAHAATSQGYFLRVHEQDTRSLVEELGLVTLPVDDAAGAKIRRMDAAKGVAVVPVVGYGEGVARIPLATFDVLWESDPLEGST